MRAPRVAAIGSVTVVTCDIDLEQSQRTVEYEGRFHGNHRRERNPATYGDLLKD